MPPDPSNDESSWDPPPPPLDYRAPDPSADPDAAVIAAGAAFTVIFLGAVWVLSNIGFGMLPPQINWEIPGAATVIMTFLWVPYLYSHRRSRHILLAAVIGFGVALLIEGACFRVINMRL